MEKIMGLEGIGGEIPKVPRSHNPKQDQKSEIKPSKELLPKDTVSISDEAIELYERVKKNNESDILIEVKRKEDAIKIKTTQPNLESTILARLKRLFT